MIILPSRGRPASVVRFIQSYRDTSAEAPIILLLDNDDPSLRQYLTLELPATWECHIGKRRKCPQACQWLFNHYPSEPWYCLMGDDVVPSTAHWDTRLIHAAGTKRVAYGDDLCPNRQATHPVVGGDLVRAVGWFAWPLAIHWYMDTAWEWLARVTDRLVYLPEVITEHRHVDFGTAPDDATYQDRWKDLQSGHVYSSTDDRATWNTWHSSGEANKVAQRIRELCPL